MWPFSKKISPRRLEVRKTIASGRTSVWSRLRETGGVGSVVLVTGFFVALILIDTVPADPLSYREGQYMPNDVHARVAFSVLSAERQRELQQKAEFTTPPVFRLNTALVDEILAALKNLPDQLNATTQPDDLDRELGEVFALNEVPNSATLRGKIYGLLQRRIQEGRLELGRQ